MPSLFTDGLVVLLQNAGSALTAGVCMLWGAIVVTAVLSKILPGELTAAEHLSIALGGWVVPVVVIAIPIFLVGASLGVRPGLIIAGATLAIIAIGAILLPIRRRAHLNALNAIGLVGLLAALVVVAVARLGFAARTALPLYFDSAEHYRIARLLAEAYAQGSPGGSLTWPTPSYYHLGYHLVMALMTVIPRQDLASMMLVSGQLVLAAIPFCLLFLVRGETSSWGAGMMAVVLGFAGWYMPAFAVNWGKYPALFSLPAVIFCLDVGYLAGKRTGGQRAILLLVGLVAALAASVLQTRALILIAIGLAAWWSAGIWIRASRALRAVVLSLVVIGGAIVIRIIGISPTLAVVFDPYTVAGLGMTIFAGLLGAMGFSRYPRLAFAALLATLLLLLGLLTPVPGFSLSPLLDRPLVEMVLFLPLALLAGCGTAAIADYFSPVPMPVKAGGIALLSLAVIAHAALNYSWYPSDCCELVHGDDLVALDWIEKNLPENSVVAISQDELRDAPEPYQGLQAATDAGAWVTALTSRRSAGMPRTSDFRSQAMFRQLCDAGVDAVYVGSTGFDSTGLAAQPSWYHPELILPGAQIYSVTGCKTAHMPGTVTVVKSP